MKYIVDTDALIRCLDCLDGIKVNGEIYLSLKLLQEFIRRFPKDTLVPDMADITNIKIEESNYASK